MLARLAVAITADAREGVSLEPRAKLGYLLAEIAESGLRFEFATCLHECLAGGRELDLLLQSGDLLTSMSFFRRASC